MKVLKIELIVVDFDGLGPEEAAEVIKNNHYPNHCMSPLVLSVQSREIGDWSDDHAFNLNNWRDEAERLFK